ncbi:DUF443 family protein [Staphylococcus agnetis]|uniref:DUF443 family protein n=3 Tax=Staphylococcus agnetis TaxID=985762 RepID=UPI000CD2A197|nr:DUF443 family protein [Staphylococcus agnetis]MBY7664184.1 DUF443 family protein [Staphylococcus agnetis]MCO4326849.1 DUF443 family protein [Staphylococcus agnetis]MCO4357742.1 DUF443 family protein [Staphylococcus agnetis]MCO4363252.1 DUF443 family protein [Staphylococcus agnetis]MCO4368576.1 DUF443 family protein [Staphylococcus agnetis]
MNKQKVNGTIEHVHKNFRYKIFNSDQGIFLIDLHQNIWSYLFPFLNWLPLKAVKLTDDDYYSLKTSIHHNKVNKNFIYSIGGISVLLSTLLRPLSNEPGYPISFFTSILFVSVIMLFLIIVHYYFRKRLEIQDMNFEMTHFKIRVIPLWKFKAIYILGYLFFWLLFIMLLILIVYENLFNLVLAMMFIVLSFCISLANSAACSISKVKAILYARGSDLFDE